MQAPISFVAAASVTQQCPAASMPQTFAMPAVDSGNLDLQISVSAGCIGYLAFAAGAPVGPNSPGCLVVGTGGPTLLLNNPAVFNAALATGRLLAKCNGSPTDPYGAVMAAAQGAVAAAATQFTALVNPPGGTVTITRGTATPSTQF